MNFENNIKKILENQERYLKEHGINISVPEPKRLFPDVNTCKSCNHHFPSNKKNFKYVYNGNVRRCKIWNCMIITEEITCDFYSPTMISGMQQIMMNTLKSIYPKCVKHDFKEFNIVKVKVDS